MKQILSPRSLFTLCTAFFFAASLALTGCADSLSGPDIDAVTETTLNGKGTSTDQGGSHNEGNVKSSESVTAYGKGTSTDQGGSHNEGN